MTERFRPEYDTSNDLVDAAIDAAERGDGRRGRVLAERALAEWPDNPDAHQQLGIHATDPTERYRHFEAARQAGLAAIPQDAFTTPGYSFWYDLDSRPYMRAVHALALEERRQGCTWEALKRTAHLLELQPADPLGVRYLHASWLLEMGRFPEANEFCRRLWIANCTREAPTPNGCTLKPEHEDLELAYARVIALHHTSPRRGRTLPEADRLLRTTFRRDPLAGLLVMGRSGADDLERAVVLARAEIGPAVYLEGYFAQWPETRDWMRKSLSEIIAAYQLALANLQ